MTGKSRVPNGVIFRGYRFWGVLRFGLVFCCISVFGRKMVHMVPGSDYVKSRIDNERP